MADAIDNLAQDLNQASAVDEFPGYPRYKMGDLVPNMAGVRVGDLFYGLDPYGQEAPYNWRTGGFEYKAAPSDVGFGNIDYNVRDKPIERINIKSGDEQDALIRTGIGTPLDPVTQQRYNTTGTTPSPVGGVDYLTPKQIEDLTAGQTPSVPQGVVTPSKTVSIPGKTLPDYIPIGQMENGDVLYADKNNLMDTIIRPSAYSVSQEDLDKGVVPQKFNFGINTELAPSQKTPTSVGAIEPTATSVGGFDNTGGNVTAGPSVSGPGGTTNVTPGYVPKPEVKPGDEFKDSPWSVFDPTGKGDKLAPYTSPSGEVFPTDQNGYKWNYQTQQFDCVGGKCSEKPPVKDTGTTTTTPGVGTGTTPTPGGGTTSGGTPPGGTTTSLPTRPFIPGIPLVRSETVIPTKGTKEVPLPDRQADPFAKLYADLLANSQQQQDKYRYINYDPDQIMNAAMSGFRRRGAMRSLQGY
jgi:hypothetical protein